MKEYTIQELAAIFRAHPGEQAKVAREQDRTPTAITQVLKGRSRSSKLLAALQRRAAELEAHDEVRRRAARKAG